MSATPKSRPPLAELTKLLGPRFRTFLAPRARKARIYCLRCHDGWWISRQEALMHPERWAYLRGHRCPRKR
jgi:hypothetical protein